MYYPYPCNDGKHHYHIVTRSGKNIKFGDAGYSDVPTHKD